MDISNIKRSFLVTGLFLVLLLLFIIVLTSILFSQNKMNFQNPVMIRKNPTVTFAAGEALFKSDSSDWNDIEIGSRLHEGHTIKTGPDGIVDLVFSNGTAMRVSEDSILVIESLNLENLSVRMDHGSLVARFQKIFAKQDFNVRTPSIAAGIRGTELIFQADSEKTDVYGMSGITEIYNPAIPEEMILLGFQSKTSVAIDQPPSDPAQMTREEVSRFRNMLDSINTNTILSAGGLIQFKPDTVELTEESKAELSELAKKMRWRFYRIEIMGHTADIGDSRSQYTLSVQRAEAVRTYLIEHKIAADRISVRGFGGSKPISTNETREGRALNRRVEIVKIE